MTPPQRRVLLRLTTLLAIVASAAVLAWALLDPVRVEEPRPGRAPKPAAGKDPVQGVAHAPSFDAAALAQLAAMDLRRPLFDPEPPPNMAGQANAGAPALTVELIGTAREPGHSMALFRRPNGIVEVRGEGETLENAPGLLTVVRVTTAAVTVQHAGQVFDLQPPPPPGQEALP